MVHVNPIYGQNPQTGTVEIYRLAGGHGSLPITVDSAYKLHLSVSRRLTLGMTAGVHRFDSKVGHAHPTIEVQIKPGVTTYLLFQYTPPSFGAAMVGDVNLNLTLSQTNEAPAGTYKDEAIDANDVAATAILPPLHQAPDPAAESQAAISTQHETKVAPAVFPSANSATLTNASIIKMSEMGLDGPVIIAVIQTQSSEFDVSPASLELLTKAKVPSSAIAAMIQKSASAPKEPKLFGKQITPVLFESAPYFTNGRTAQMIEAPSIHILAFIAEENDQYGYKKLAVMLRNTGANSIDFDPQTQMTAYSDPSKNLSEKPMDTASVAAIASKIKRRQSVGIFAAGVVGSLAANQYSEYSATNTYEQARSDQATDAAGVASQEQFDNAIQNQFLRSTVEPQELVQGWVYFQIPKNGKKLTSDFQPEYLDTTISGITYRLAID